MDLHENFSDQVAIVTGAGTGIGFEIARQLLDRGAQVIINDIDEHLINTAAQKLANPDRCKPVPGDAGDLTIIDQMISTAMGHFGKLDIAIANAGITSYGSFLKFTPEQFSSLIHLNLQGSFFLAQKSAHQMIAQQRPGRILLMSSVTGVLSHPFLGAYGMTKAAISNLAKNLVLELGKYGITVNAIAPGAVGTERTMAMDPNYDKVWGGLIPTGRATTTAEIARTALFLVSPDSGQINGQTLVVDGGITTLCAVPPDTDDPG